MRAPTSGARVARSDIERLHVLTTELASPLSEYRAANLYLFRTVHDYRWAETDAPALTGRTYDGVRHLTPLVRGAVSGLAAALAENEVLFPLAAVDTQGLESTSNPDDTDYVFDVQDLATCRGQARKGPRNLRSHFRRLHHPREAALEPSSQAAAFEVLDGWLADVGWRPDKTDYLACREALELQAALGLEGLVAFTAEGRPAGFLLASVLHGMAVVHFAKGRRDLAGVYPHLFSRFAEGAGERFATINFEQDLGKPGFRQNKRAYGPSVLLAKHRLTRAAAFSAISSRPR